MERADEPLLPRVRLGLLPCVLGECTAAARDRVGLCLTYNGGREVSAFGGLVVPEGGRLYPSEGEPRIGIRHVGCSDLAGITIELDCWFCASCHRQGRISGAWVLDMMKRYGRGGLK